MLGWVEREKQPGMGSALQGHAIVAALTRIASNSPPPCNACR